MQIQRTVQADHPYSVFYDIQKDKYFRIDKSTGEVKPSFKTGKLPAKFDSSITGTDYVARKQKTPAQPQYFYPQSINVQKLQNNSRKQQNRSLNQDSNMIEENSDGIHEIEIKNQNQSNSPGMLRYLKKKGVHKNNIKQQAEEMYTKILPRIRKQNSLSILQKKNADDSLSSTILHTIRNSDSEALGKKVLAQKDRQKAKDSFFFNSISKLSLISEPISVSQSKINFSCFQNKLKKYSQLGLQKYQSQNTYERQTIASQNAYKAGQTSLLTSLLDQTNFQANQLSRINRSMLAVQRKDNTVNKLKIIDELKNESQEKKALLLLAKKCKQQTKSIKSSKTMGSLKNNPPSNLKAIDMQNSQKKIRLKAQLVKQKQVFIQFNPQYIFKQNPRLIQEQKDRRINFKKLERLFLQNNQRKYGKIYRSKSKDADEQK